MVCGKEVSACVWGKSELGWDVYGAGAGSADGHADAEQGGAQCHGGQATRGRKEVRPAVLRVGRRPLERPPILADIY